MDARGCSNDGAECHAVQAGRGRGLAVIFKGTSACNAGCRFCSAADAKGHSITAEDFEIVANRIDEYVGEAGIEHLNFTFHGGEPTLLGAEFLDRACSRLRRLPIPVEFSMQSNLLLFPAATVAVVQRWSIRVGTSVDPITSGRCTANGNDYFQEWLRNLAALAKAEIGVGAIFLVTRPSLGQGKRVYEILSSLRSLGEAPSGLQFNLVYPQGRAAMNSELLVTAEEGGQFLVDAYEAWEDSGRADSASPFDDLAVWFDSKRTQAPRLTCGFMGNCHQTHIGIDAGLNLAGCGRRLDSQAFYGCIRTQSISSLLTASEERKKLATRSRELSEGDCANCEFFALCHGGCPDDAALGEGDAMARTSHCAAYLMLFKAMAARAGAPRAQPEKLQPAADAVIHVGTNAGEAPSFIRHGEHLESWLLAADGGSTLEFSSHLKNVLLTGANRIKIFVSGAHVNRLHLWARVLADPRVEVALFDCPEALQESLAILGRLGARASLEFGSLFERGWPEAEALALARRYLREPGWKLRLEPFESILLAAVRGERVPVTNRYGMIPGHYRVCIGSLAGASEDALRLVKVLREAESNTAVSYFDDRRACLDCKGFVVCGSRMASLAAGGCGEPLHEIVSLLQDSAIEIRGNLGEGRERSSPIDVERSHNS